jgi:hypothetical protein
MHWSDEQKEEENKEEEVKLVALAKIIVFFIWTTLGGCYL